MHSWEFRQFIDAFFLVTPPTGTRHRRPLERAKRAKVTLSSIALSEKWQEEPNIVVLYLVDEEVWEGEMRRLKSSRAPKKKISSDKTALPNPAPKMPTVGKRKRAIGKVPGGGKQH